MDSTDSDRQVPITFVSDLVRDSKLATRFDGQFTQHWKYVPGKQRKVKHYQRWLRMKYLGGGASGTIWLEGLVRPEGHEDFSSERELRAVKEIRKEVAGSVAKYYNRELEALAKFSHEKYYHCFVRSYGWFENEKRVFIPMEYFEHGDLQRYLSTPLSENEAQRITHQILEGVGFLHDNGFAHRDLKPNNILVQEKGPDWWVKIGDFGISKRAQEGQTALHTFGGTPSFMAPEVLLRELGDDINLPQQQQYTVTVDIWSVGVIAFQILTSKVPFTSRDLRNYAKGKSVFPEEELVNQGSSQEACDFIKSLLNPEPAKRPNVKVCLKHAWLKDQEPLSEDSDDDDNFPDVNLTPLVLDDDVQPTLASARWTTADETINPISSHSTLTQEPFVVTTSRFSGDATRPIAHTSGAKSPAGTVQSRSALTVPTIMLQQTSSAHLNRENSAPTEAGREEMVELPGKMGTQGRKGRTRIPKRMVSKQAVIDKNLPFEEEESFIIVQRALGKEHIDELIKKSKEYTTKESRPLKAPPAPGYETDSEYAEAEAIPGTPEKPNLRETRSLWPDIETGSPISLYMPRERRPYSMSSKSMGTSTSNLVETFPSALDGNHSSPLQAFASGFTRAYLSPDPQGESRDAQSEERRHSSERSRMRAHTGTETPRSSNHEDVNQDAGRKSRKKDGLKESDSAWAEMKASTPPKRGNKDDSNHGDAGRGMLYGEVGVGPVNGRNEDSRRQTKSYRAWDRIQQPAVDAREQTEEGRRPERAPEKSRGRSHSASLDTHPESDPDSTARDYDAHDDSDSDSEIRRRKSRGKELLSSGLATMATIQAAHSIYSSLKASDKRHKAVAEGDLSLEEARKLTMKNRMQDAASVGIAALGIKGAFDSMEKSEKPRNSDLSEGSESSSLDEYAPTRRSKSVREKQPQRSRSQIPSSSKPAEEHYGEIPSEYTRKYNEWPKSYSEEEVQVSKPRVYDDIKFQRSGREERRSGEPPFSKQSGQQPKNYRQDYVTPARYYDIHR